MMVRNLVTEGMILRPRLLEGDHVSLEPATEAHREEMREALHVSPETWKILLISGYGEHFPAYWDKLIGTPDRISFAVRDRKSGRLAGTSSFLAVDPDHRKLEIGYTFLRPEFRGTYANPEAKLLMLAEAFGVGAYRVQFSVNTLNERSQAAVLKLGARPEGVLRRHLITWTGQKRDTALFSIIDSEWPEVRSRLGARLLQMQAA